MNSKSQTTNDKAVAPATESKVKGNGEDPLKGGPPVPASMKRTAPTPKEAKKRRQKEARARATTTKKAKAKDKRIFAKAHKTRTLKKATGKSQAEAIVARLKHKGGATIEQLMAASDASKKNVQWYLSQHVKRKLELPLVREGKVYRIEGRPQS